MIYIKKTGTLGDGVVIDFLNKTIFLNVFLVSLDFFPMVSPRYNKTLIMVKQ